MSNYSPRCSSCLVLNTAVEDRAVNDPPVGRNKRVCFNELPVDSNLTWCGKEEYLGVGLVIDSLGAVYSCVRAWTTGST